MKNLYRTVKSGKNHPTLKWKTLTPQNGNFCFGYHKHSKKCFLSLYGFYWETTTDEIKELIKRFDMGELKKELEKIQIFFGLNKTVNWYFLI